MLIKQIYKLKIDTIKWEFQLYKGLLDKQILLFVFISKHFWFVFSEVETLQWNQIACCKETFLHLQVKLPVKLGNTIMVFFKYASRLIFHFFLFSVINLNRWLLPHGNYLEYSLLPQRILIQHFYMKESPTFEDYSRKFCLYTFFIDQITNFSFQKKSAFKFTLEALRLMDWKLFLFIENTSMGIYYLKNVFVLW